MNKESLTVKETFLSELSKHMDTGDELSLKTIYSLFPEINRKTISWRLYSMVQQGMLYKTGHGFYSKDRKTKENLAAGYEYLQRKSKEVFDILIEYGYDFYITGIDSLVGEILHLPENYPVLVITEEFGMKDIQDALSGREMMVLTEKDQDILEKTALRNKVDVILLNGKDFSLAKDYISQKEKGFVDLYYVITRLNYGVSIPELSRIYQSLQRNNSITVTKLRGAAKDRGIAMEIDWLIGLKKATEKTIEFMNYQIKEAKWS